MSPSNSTEPICFAMKFSDTEFTHRDSHWGRSSTRGYLKVKSFIPTSYMEVAVNITNTAYATQAESV